jgi:DNA primase
MNNPVATHPIDSILPLLKKVKALHNGRGYVACCPAHNDGNPSLTIWEDGPDHVGLKCYAGCQHSAILEALGLTWVALYKDRKPKPRPSTGLHSMYDLAEDKLIHPHLFDVLGITDGHVDAGKTSVHIPYYDQNGHPYERYRIRTALKAKEGSLWSKGRASLIPYGLQRLEDARKAGYLILSEGESDCWTLWFHDLPALGIPGADNTACLQAQYLEDIPRVYIVKEDDQGGLAFAKNMQKRLAAIGYKGKPYVVDMHALGANDANELHKKDLRTFKAIFEQALQHAEPLFKERKHITLDRLCDLLQETLPDVRWAIEPILPEGCTVLAGKPKLGKSFLALGILIAIALGGVALGQYPVEQGEVLYLDLENGKRRLQKRARKMLQHAFTSPDFYYKTEWPRMNEGGLEELEHVLDQHPRMRTICIDTWGRFKPKSKGRNTTQYDEDYDAMQPLQALATRREVTILVIDHMRKMDADDPIDQVSGSVGKAGAVDGFLLLYRKRHETDARLAVIGRDIEEEQEIVLSYDRECASWTAKGDADDDAIATTPERQKILDLLAQHEQGLTCKEIADKLNKNVNTTRNQLCELRHTQKKIDYKDNRYLLVRFSSKDSMTSNSSKTSKDSNPLETEEIEPGVTSQGERRLVTNSNLVIEPIERNCESELLGVTSLTTLTSGDYITAFCSEQGAVLTGLEVKRVTPLYIEAQRFGQPYRVLASDFPSVRKMQK